MSQILLSIGMIVKNEIRCLEKCLKALEPLRTAIPCELVIADTGSNDGTREIAARYADIFFDLPWENDFSAARNAVLDRCTGQWYFSVDADEYLDEYIDELVAFLLNSEKNEHNFALVVNSNFSDQTLDKETATSFFAVRLARRRPGLRFIGAIHERFNFKDDEIFDALSNTILWHDGYAYETPEQARRKKQRNMELLEQELRRAPTDPLRIVQCIESSRDAEEQIRYIQQGMSQILADAPGWNQQGAVLLSYAVQLASMIGSEKLREWSDLAYTRYPESPMTQIDLNAAMAVHYSRCYQWQEALEAADAYWEGVQKLERNEFPVGVFATISLHFNSQASREDMALLQAEACHHLNRPGLAVQVLQAVPLRTIGLPNIKRLLNVLALISDKTNVAKLFSGDAKKILKEEPASREDWGRRDALRKALNNMFEQPKEKRLPASVLEELQDGVYAPAAAIMETENVETMQEIAQSIADWKQIPAAVVQKLVEARAAMPELFFQTMEYDHICGLARYLVRHLDNEAERILQIVEELDTSDVVMTVWRFKLLSELCVWFKWKNMKQAEELFQAYCKATDSYLKMVYPTGLLQSDYMYAVLPQDCRFAYGCLQAEKQLQANDEANCIHTLKDLLKMAPSMREMVRFLTERVAHITQERRMRMAVTPQLITMAKQVRAILMQYPENSPTAFMLKSRKKKKKMKFLIEDPNLDDM